MNIQMRSRVGLVMGLMLVGVLAGAGHGMTAIAAPRLSSDRPVTPEPTAIAKAAPLPAAVITTLRQDLSRQTKIPANQLRFVEATPQTWPDGCFGLAKPDEMCTQMMTPGWRVVFAKGNQRWVYRTNQTGRTYRLEPAARTSQRPPASGGTVLTPTQIPVAELPPPLPRNAVFRSISTGGIAGLSRQMTLYRDGRLVQESLRPNVPPYTPQVRQLTPQQMRQFLTVLRQSQLQALDRANYPATPGSADFFTVTLSGQNSTIRYADSVQSQLPTQVQRAIAAWQQLTL